MPLALVSSAQFDSLLSEVGTVSWSTMTHCRGDATDLPEQLRVWLTTDDDEERREMESQLWDELQYQGSTFQPTAPATRIIAGALPLQREDPSALTLVIWLGAMARGYTMTEGQGMLRWVPKGDLKRPEVERQYELERGWVHEVHAAAWRAYPTLTTLFRERPHRALSLHLPYVIKGLLVDAADGCPADVDRVTTAREFSALVTTRFRATTDDLLRAGYAFAIGALQDLVPANTDFLEEIADPNGGAGAAVAATYLAYRRPGPAVAETLARALEQHERHRSWFPDDPWCPWLTGHFRFDLIQAIASGTLSDADFDRALPAIVDVFRTTASCYTVDRDVAPVLARVFGAGKASDASALDERQRRVLAALYDNEKFWDVHSGNVAAAMRRIGLENDRALVGKLLGVA